jgi:hypothetical protein
MTLLQIISMLWGLWLLLWLVMGMRAKPVEARESFASRLSHMVPKILGAARYLSSRLDTVWLRGRFIDDGPPELLAVGLVMAGLVRSLERMSHARPSRTVIGRPAPQACHFDRPRIVFFREVERFFRGLKLGNEVQG